MKTRNTTVWDIFFSVFSTHIIRISFSLKKSRGRDHVVLQAPYFFT